MGLMVEITRLLEPSRLVKHGECVWGTEGREFKSSQSDRGVSAVIENGLASFDHTG